MVKNHQQIIHITTSADEGRAKAGEKGGIETVVKVIDIHIDNADLCKHGCCALKVMMHNSKVHCFLDEL